ncbi:PEP-CTERM sorting domain-containing protein [Rhodopirellula sp.]|nr:PEP-CTERM sorting domain-containing protein [Rhodopirellula sp.]
MFRFIILSLALLCVTTCKAGYFELTSGTFTSDMFVDVVNNDGNNTIGVTDLVRTVQRFTYSEAVTDVTRTALAISVSEVASVNTLSGNRTQYLFGASTTSTSGVDSISELLSSFSGSSISNLEATNATGVSSDVFVLLTAAGDISLSATGFNFDAAAFGLDTTAGVWSADFTAAFSGTGDYQEWVQNFILPGIPITIDPITYPDNNFVNPGDGTSFKQRFAYTITQVKDDNDEFTSGSSLGVAQSFNTFTGTLTADLGTDNAFDLNYGYLGTSPTGTNLSSNDVSVSLPAPGAVPEPSSILVLAGLGVVSLASRRRRVK